MSDDFSYLEYYRDCVDECIEFREDLVEKLLVAYLKKVLRGKSFGAVRIFEKAVENLLEICSGSECFKYNCLPGFLIQCVHEYVTGGHAVPPQVNDDECREALTVLVYRSVISSVTKALRSKLADQCSPAGGLEQNQESTIVLASELSITTCPD